MDDAGNGPDRELGGGEGGGGHGVGCCLLEGTFGHEAMIFL